MTTAQQLLIFGGLISVFASVLIGYTLYWIRVRDIQRRTAAGLVSFQVTLWNGLMLFGLALAIKHTGFAGEVNNGLALAEVAVSLLAGARTVFIWARGYENIFRTQPVLARSVGLAHVVDLVVVSAVLYGVARTALGV